MYHGLWPSEVPARPRPSASSRWSRRASSLRPLAVREPAGVGRVEQGFVLLIGPVQRVHNPDVDPISFLRPRRGEPERDIAADLDAAPVALSQADGELVAFAVVQLGDSDESVAAGAAFQVVAHGSGTFFSLMISLGANFLSQTEQRIFTSSGMASSLSASTIRRSEFCKAARRCRRIARPCS